MGETKRGLRAPFQKYLRLQIYRHNVPSLHLYEMSLLNGIGAIVICMHRSIHYGCLAGPRCVCRQQKCGRCKQSKPCFDQRSHLLTFFMVGNNCIGLDKVAQLRAFLNQLFSSKIKEKNIAIKFFLCSYNVPL